jgi:hypothetical protein
MKKISHLLFPAIILLLSACTDNNNNIQLLNNKAALPASFDFSKLGLRVMTTLINRKQTTTATLYANDAAIKGAVNGNKDIKDGEVFALVTWKQQPDAHWFGARIPADFQSVELLKITGPKGKESISYQSFMGKTLVLNTDTSQNQARIKYILAQQPAVMP